MKRVLSLDDLYNFYAKQNENINFSSKNDDTTIVVHIDEPFKFSNDKIEGSKQFVDLLFCHTLENRNKSFISEKAMNNAIPSAYNIPILGYIWEDEDGVARFAGHEFFINEDDEVVYEEIPVGCIPESANLKLVESDDDRKYLSGKGVIWKTYSKAWEILKREKELSVSVEIEINDLSYSADTKILNIDAFEFLGLTILEKNPETGNEILPGMEGANIKISDFSAENNSMFSNCEETIKRIEEKLFNIEKLIQNGGEKVTKFEELLEKYNVTSEDVKFDYSEMDDDALEKAFDEFFGKDDVEADVETDAEADVEIDAEADTEVDSEGDTEGFSENEDISEDDSENVSEESSEDFSEEDNETSEDENSLSYSVKVNGKQNTFSVSLNDKINALSTLVNETYSESDLCWYDTVVFDNEKYVEMHDWWNNKHYRQNYSVKKEVYSLKGDRVEIFMNFLTKDEQNKIEQMKADFEAASEKLAKYEAEPEKVEVINSEDYACIRDTKEFKEISENHFDLSIEDIKTKLDEKLLAYAKTAKFSKTPDTKVNNVGMVQFANPKTRKTKSRYGTLFAKKK